MTTVAAPTLVKKQKHWVVVKSKHVPYDIERAAKAIEESDMLSESAGMLGAGKS